MFKTCNDYRDFVEAHKEGVDERMENKYRSEYQAAIRLVSHVATWVWPHEMMVYPRRKRVPIQANGRKQLERVLGYLQSQAHADFMNQEVR